MKIIRLRTENREHPYGIDVKNPVFSWNIFAEEQNWKQKSYRICVEKDGKCVWDSGKVMSDRMVQIPYEGESLQSDTRYEWQVEVQGTRGECSKSEKTWFETGDRKSVV